MKGFDFSTAVETLCRDMVERLPELAHIDLSRVAFSVVQARSSAPHGIYASLTPLRFENGERQKQLRGKRYTVQAVLDPSGREYLYIFSVYLPRFLNTSLEEKLTTVLHELWHISPQFDGDLRRHPGRCYAHGPSQKAYDAKMEQLAQQWLAADPPAALYAFLENDFHELVAEHGQIVGRRYAVPKLLPA